MGRVALEDKEVKQADLLSSTLPMQLPKVAKPRTTNDPEAQEVWPMTLQQAIRIGLDNSEIVRVIAFGAQGIPIGGFEPTPLNTGASAGVASSLGAGTLQSVYDPAILETQIATALSTFDTAFTTSVLWGNNVQPYNNGVQGGSLSLTGTKYPIVSVNDSATFQMGLSKQTETGATIGRRPQHQLVVPEQLVPGLALGLHDQHSAHLDPALAGKCPAAGPGGRPAGRPRGQPRSDRDRPAQRRRRRLAVQGRGHGPRAGRSSSNTGTWPSRTSSSGAPIGPSAWPRRSSIASRPSWSVGRGTVADVAEAAQRLEQFNLDLVTRTSDVITTERQLRNILGLPPADNRRIIPVTPPTEARLEPDWDASLAQMLNFQPDIVQQQILVRVAELQLLIARNQLLPQLSLNALYQLNGLGQQLDSAEAVMTGATLKASNPVIANQQTRRGPRVATRAMYSNFVTWQVGFTFQAPLGMRSPLANTRQAQYILLRARAYLQQVVHQTTHSLARFFLEIDANYKQFKTASRLRAAAAQRLDAQRAYYEEGRITIDRFLDAVSQYATAVATEAQYKTTYNISIVALEEAKGTLLAYDNIAVAEGPHPRKAYIQARDIQDAHRQFHILPDGPQYPRTPVGPLNPDPVDANPPPGVEAAQARRRMPGPGGPAGTDARRRCRRTSRPACSRSCRRRGPSRARPAGRGAGRRVPAAT